MANAPESPRSHIVVVGSFNMDLTFTTGHFPRPGETVLGAFRQGPGGKGANQAIASARVGGEVTFAGAIGQDALGEVAKDLFQREGIATQLVSLPEVPTGTAAIILEEAGENAIIVAPGANARLRAEDLPITLFAKTGVVVVQLEADLTASQHALQSGRREGAITILNPAPYRAGLSADFLAAADYLLPNETEFSALVAERHPGGFGDFTEEHLHALPDARLHELCQGLGLRHVVVTLGRRGAFVSLAEGGYHLIPALPGVKAVDTVGAGDAFTGAFAAGLVRFKGDAFQAARFANATAGLAVTRPGAAPAMPHLDEVLAAMGKMPGASN